MDGDDRTYFKAFMKLYFDKYNYRLKIKYGSTAKCND